MTKILVAAAEPRMLTYLADGLAIGGNCVHLADSIESAIDALAEERFDLIVADIFQPVLEGMAFFTTVARATPRSKIVALMDYQSARAKDYDLSLYVDSLLLKPLTIERVRQEVDWVLKLSTPRLHAPVPA